MLRMELRLTASLARPRCALRTCSRRSLAAEAASGHASSSSPITEPFAAGDRSSETSEPETSGTQKLKWNSIRVRPWDGISSMPELFAMIRAVERKYGKIREFQVFRDHEISTTYMSDILVSFHDPTVLERVPAKPSVLKVQVPDVDYTRPGGIGLEDLQGLLRTKNTTLIVQESLNEPENDHTRTVELKIQGSTRPLYFEVGADRPSISLPFLSAFYRWGGFYNPVPPQQPLPWMSRGRARWDVIQAKTGMYTSKTKRDATPSMHDEFSAAGELSSSEPTASSEADPATAVSEQPAPHFDDSIIPKHAPIRVYAPSTVNVQEASPQSAERESAEPQTLSPATSRRERLLALARENARTPIPASVKATEKVKEEERTRQREKEREEGGRMKKSIRERILKLMGGKWL